MLPTILLFVNSNVLQMQVLLHIWRSRNEEMLNNNPVLVYPLKLQDVEEVRTALIRYKCKLCNNVHDSP